MNFNPTPNSSKRSIPSSRTSQRSVPNSKDMDINTNEAARLAFDNLKRQNIMSNIPTPKSGMSSSRTSKRSVDVDSFKDMNIKTNEAARLAFDNLKRQNIMSNIPTPKSSMSSSRTSKRSGESSIDVDINPNIPARLLDCNNFKDQNTMNKNQSSKSSHRATPSSRTSRRSAESFQDVDINTNESVRLLRNNLVDQNTMNYNQIPQSRKEKNPSRRVSKKSVDCFKYVDPNSNEAARLAFDNLKREDLMPKFSRTRIPTYRIWERSVESFKDVGVNTNEYVRSERDSLDVQITMNIPQSSRIRIPSSSVKSFKDAVINTDEVDCSSCENLRDQLRLIYDQYNSLSCHATQCHRIIDHLSGPKKEYQPEFGPAIKISAEFLPPVYTDSDDDVGDNESNKMDVPKKPEILCGDDFLFTLKLDSCSEDDSTAADGDDSSLKKNTPEPKLDARVDDNPYIIKKSSIKYSRDTPSTSKDNRYNSKDSTKTINNKPEVQTSKSKELQCRPRTSKSGKCESKLPISRKTRREPTFVYVKRRSFSPCSFPKANKKEYRKSINPFRKLRLRKQKMYERVMKVSSTPNIGAKQWIIRWQN